MKNIVTGRTGENLASDYIVKKGYRIIAANFRTRYAELDIVAKKDDYLVFFEVKTRKSNLYGEPYESVNAHKFKKIRLAIDYFLLTKKIVNYKLRMDVISIILNSDLSICSLKHFENVGIY